MDRRHDEVVLSSSNEEASGALRELANGLGETNSGRCDNKAGRVGGEVEGKPTGVKRNLDFATIFLRIGRRKSAAKGKEGEISPVRFRSDKPKGSLSSPTTGRSNHIL